MQMVNHRGNGYIVQDTGA